MTPTALRTQAQELVAKAQQSLDDALASGGDTTTARDRLAAAQGKLRALDTHIAPIVDLDAAAQNEAEATAMLATAEAAILAKLSAYQPPAPLPPALPMGLGLAVVNARRIDTEAQSAIAAHDAQGEQLASRLAAIRAKREAIAARRMAGQGDDEVDGRQLGLISLDEQGLLALLARHQAERPQDPGAEVGAMMAWREGVALVELRAMQAQAQSLQVALVNCATELARKAGPRTSFRLRTDPVLSTAARLGVF
ncbi:MAG: hypothetical protein IT487_06405 [Chromatiaceae bacterium]|nr:hypothetical protein [Chromatiaceae bacterium]